MMMNGSLFGNDFNYITLLWVCTRFITKTEDTWKLMNTS